jgi:hypothetical protein
MSIKTIGFSAAANQAANWGTGNKNISANEILNAHFLNGNKRWQLKNCKACSHGLQELSMNGEHSVSAERDWMGICHDKWQ